MRMNSTMLDRLEARFDFESWRDSNTLGPNLFVWRLFLSGTELPGWQAARIDVLTFEGWPPGIQSVWTPESDGTDTLLRLDLFQCTSAADAKWFLLRTLGEFQSPRLARRGRPGDVVFSMGEAAVRFARGNLVVTVRNAGARVIPVIELAGILGTRLSSRSEEAQQQVVPTIAQFEVVLDPTGGGFRLDLEAADPLERRYGSSCSREVVRSSRRARICAIAPAPARSPSPRTRSILTGASPCARFR
jgi:hypothetical protein